MSFNCASHSTHSLCTRNLKWNFLAARYLARLRKPWHRLRILHAPRCPQTAQNAHLKRSFRVCWLLSAEQATMFRLFRSYLSNFSVSGWGYRVFESLILHFCGFWSVCTVWLKISNKKRYAWGGKKYTFLETSTRKLLLFWDHFLKLNLEIE